MSADKFQYDVFLSHNSADKPRILKLAERLRAEGLQVETETGLETARVQVLCLSHAALDAGWVNLERSTVPFRDPTNEGRQFIPLILADCELPDTLRRYKYVDFRDEATEAFAELLASCQTEAELPSLDPPPKAAASKPSKKRTRKPEKKGAPKATPDKEAEPPAVLERTLAAGWVNSVAVSPDGTWAVSGAGDWTVKIWDLETGKCKAALKRHTSQVRSVAITPDGQLIVSASRDTSVRVWESIPGQELAMLQGHTGVVRSVVAFQDNARALSGGFDGTLRVWDLATLSCLRTLRCGTEEADDVFSCAVVRTGTWALSGHRDGSIRLWNLETGEALATLLSRHSGCVHSIQITPDGRFAVSGSEDTTVKIWNLKTRTCVGTLEGHQSYVQSVTISPDGTLIASTGYRDETVRLWDWKSGTCLQVLRFKGAPSPTSVAFSPEGSRLVVGTTNSPIFVYRLTGIHPMFSAETTRRYVNAKVVLLGEGTVGKTSLAHRLVEDCYVVRDRTHGMNVCRLELPLAPDVSLEREALLWDLAGQEDYRLIHQLFLEETALALLLVNPQKDDPFAEAGDWLKALKTAARGPAQRDVARLLVFSQIDVGGMKLGNAKIERFKEQHGFAGWLPTSAKTGANCSDEASGGQASPLKRLIAESIPWDKLPWTSTPRLLAELKNAVVAMRDESDIRLLRFAELAQRLEQVLPDEKFGESEVRTAVTLLANHGLARPLPFGDLVLLRPDLLNGYAGAIIRAARAHTDEIGCVLEADIYKPTFDFTGVDRLKGADEGLLLHALVQTFLDRSLCIAEDTPQGRHLVFPSQYRREKDIPHEPDIFVSYTFSGEWQTVWTTLVVRLWYSQEFEHRELWRNAAEFASPKGHTLGMLIKKNHDGEATISLYFDVRVPDELKANFIGYVHQHLARYAFDVTRDRRYVCPQCAKPVKDLNAVRKRLEAKKDFITCQECDEKVLLLDFIEQRLKSDPVARKILAMEEEATRQLDSQALEQILIGHMMAIAGEANQIYRPVSMFDYGIDGEVEFKDNDGRASGKRIYIQLKSGNSYLRTRKSDGIEVFDVKNDRHLDYWVSHPVDIYLVIRQTDEMGGGGTIRWMNVTRYLKARKDKESRQILFTGEKLDAAAVWNVRDQFFPPGGPRRGRSTGETAVV